MKRATVNLVLACLAAIVMMGLIWTGIIIRYTLPPGSGASRFLWGLARHQWGDVHFWLAVAMGGVVLLHVALHWTWVISVIAGRRMGRQGRAPSAPRRVLAGAGVLVSLAGLILGLWLLSLRQVENRQQAGVGAGRRGDESAIGHIQGSMTLAEVAQATGSPVEAVRQCLGLPGEVRETDKLGQLSHAYGFTMAEARRRLAGLPETTTCPQTPTGQE